MASVSDLLDVLLVAQAELEIDGVDEKLLEDLVVVLGECDVFTVAELRLAFCTAASQAPLRLLLADGSVDVAFSGVGPGPGGCRACVDGSCYAGNFGIASWQSFRYSAGGALHVAGWAPCARV